MADVGHAAADKDFVDLGADHVRQGFHIVRIVGARQDRLMNFSQVDLNHSSVLGVRVGLEQLRVGQPGFHGGDAAFDGAHVRVTGSDHPLEHGDVAVDVLDDGFLVQVHRATTGTALGRSVAQLKGLLDLQVWQAFDFENAAREHIDLALLGHGQQTGLDGVQRNGADQVTQGDAGLHLAFEAHQDALGHVQRHDAGGGTESHQTGAGRKADADRETRVAVAAGADGVGQQHAVEPAVDDAISGAQRDTATRGDELGQLVVHLHVHRLGVSGCMAKRLHDEVGAETQAGQVFELVAGHRAGRVLRADRCHLRLAIRAGANALAFRQTNRTADHFLRQCKTTAAVHRGLRQAENCRSRQAQRSPRLGRQSTSDNQRNAAAGAHFVKQDLTFECEFGNHFAALQGFAFVRTQLKYVAHAHLAHVQLDRQRARVFHGVVENRGDLAAQADAAKTFVGHKGNVFAGPPQYRVSGRFA